jgi:hypothetical protein
VGSKLCVCGFGVSLDFGFGVGDWTALICIWTFQVSGIGNVGVKAAFFFQMWERSRPGWMGILEVGNIYISSQIPRVRSWDRNQCGTGVGNMKHQIARK